MECRLTPHIYNSKAAAHVACIPSVLVHCKAVKKKEFDYLDRPAIGIWGFTTYKICNFVSGVISM